MTLLEQVRNLLYWGLHNWGLLFLINYGLILYWCYFQAKDVSFKILHAYEVKTM